MANQSIFISYAYPDRVTALLLEHELSRAGVKVWMDSNFLKPGNKWKPALLEAVDRSDIVVVLISGATIYSDDAIDEIRHGLKNQKRIVPVLLTPQYQLLRELESEKGLKLDDIWVPTIESAQAFHKFANDLIEMAHPNISTILNSLREREFSDTFISVYKRMMLERREDAITFYYSGQLELSEAIEIERAINQSIRRLLIPTDESGELQLLLNNQRDIFTINSFTHPGSSQIILELSRVALIVASSPEVQAFLLGLATNAVYDAMKVIANQARTRFFATRMNEDTPELFESPRDVDSVTPSQPISETMESTERNSRFVIVGGWRLEWGTEKRIMERTILEG